MKTEILNAGWTLSGRIKGAGQAICRESLALPFSLSNFADLCGRDGLFLREWTFSAYVSKPQERKTSLTERWFLTLDGIEGKGSLKIGEETKALTSHMEVELTKQMREGGCAVSLVFPPHLPRLLPGEMGQDLPVEIGLFSAKVRGVYFLRLTDFDVHNGNAEVMMEAFAAGRVLVKLRLLHGDALLWHENREMNVSVGENALLCPIPLDVPNGAVLKISVERGGEGCDEGEKVVCGNLPEPKVSAHFRKEPPEAVLQILAESGFHAVVLHTSPNEALEGRCRALGLRLISAPKDFPVRPMLHYEETEACPLPLCGEEGKAELLTQYVLSRREKGADIRLYAGGRQKDDPAGLFTADGEALPCLAAVTKALSPVFVTAVPDKPHCIPGAPLNLSIDLYQQGHDGKVLRVEAHLAGGDRRELKAGFFTVCAKGNRQSVGTLATQIPWNLSGDLMLRLQVMRQEECLCENKIKIPLCTGGIRLSEYEN